jgi:hypothetical protein
MRFRRAGLALVLFLSIWPPAAADTLTSLDVARLRSVSAVAISVDGSRVAYTLSVARRPMEEEDGPAWAELHVRARATATASLPTVSTTTSG